MVVLRVPPSSTFLQGAMLCDVTSASADLLDCTTRGHLAANASASDPLAHALQPQPTAARSAAAAPPLLRLLAAWLHAVAPLPRAHSPSRPCNPACRTVEVVICPGAATDAEKLACWAAASGSSSGSSCFAEDPADCTWSYTWDKTPRVAQLQPASGNAGTPVTVEGDNLDYVTSVTVTNGLVSAPALLLWQGATSLQVMVPALPGGAYKMQLQTSSGELAVAARGVDTFNYVPIVVGASGVKGGLMGGVQLTLTAAGSAGFNTSGLDVNQVGPPGPAGRAEASALHVRVLVAAAVHASGATAIKQTSWMQSSLTHHHHHHHHPPPADIRGRPALPRHCCLRAQRDLQCAAPVRAHQGRVLGASVGQGGHRAACL